LRPCEKESLQYGEKLKEKFAHHPQIRRISNYRHVPKRILAARREHAIIRKSRKIKCVVLDKAVLMCYVWLIFLVQGGQKENAQQRRGC
jgi:hypothetical protein